MPVVKGERLRVTGVVQGVGFRPTVWRIANSLSLSGHVLNDGEGVQIDLWGAPDSLARFAAELEQQCPPLATIEHIERSALKRPSPVEALLLRPVKAANMSPPVCQPMRLSALHALRKPLTRQAGATVTRLPIAPTAVPAFPSLTPCRMTGRVPAWRCSLYANRAGKSMTIRLTAASMHSRLPVRTAAPKSGFLMPQERLSSRNRWGRRTPSPLLPV